MQMQLQATQKIAQAKIDDARDFVERHQRAIKMIATATIAVALLLWAIVLGAVKVLAAVTVAIYDRIRHHAIVAETVASGKNCRIALAPPKHLREGEYKNYHDELMKSRPNWLIAAESFRQKAAQRLIQLRDRTRDRIDSEVAAITAALMGI
jgi:hypothetical protein